MPYLDIFFWNLTNTIAVQKKIVFPNVCHFFYKAIFVVSKLELGTVYRILTVSILLQVESIRNIYDGSLHCRCEYVLFSLWVKWLQCTEVVEYALVLRIRTPFDIPTLQIFRDLCKHWSLFGPLLTHPQCKFFASCVNIGRYSDIFCILHFFIDFCKSQKKVFGFSNRRRFGWRCVLWKT